MKKLSKDQLAEHGRIVADLRVKEEVFLGEIENYNAARLALWAPVEGAMSALNEARSDANNFHDEVTGDMESYAGERSDRWHESDAAASFSEWQSTWEQFGAEEIELDAPDGFEPQESAADEFESLPVEVNQ